MLAACRHDLAGQRLHLSLSLLCPSAVHCTVRTVAPPSESSSSAVSFLADCNCSLTCVHPFNGAVVWTCILHCPPPNPFKRRSLTDRFLTRCVPVYAAAAAASVDYNLSICACCQHTHTHTLRGGGLVSPQICAFYLFTAVL